MEVLGVERSERFKCGDSNSNKIPETRSVFRSRRESREEGERGLIWAGVYILCIPRFRFKFQDMLSRAANDPIIFCRTAH